MPAEPYARILDSQGQPRPYSRSNAYHNRWRLWYSQIADWLIHNPGGHLKDCAAAIGRGHDAIVAISRSDTFQDYYVRRREEFQRDCDDRLKYKLTGIAAKSLDIVMAELEKKGDQTPLPIAVKIAESALDRLGFAPNSQPQTVVNVAGADNRTVVLQGVSAQALEEARTALRRAEQKQSMGSLDSLTGGECGEPGAANSIGPSAKVIGEMEVSGDPTSR